MAVIITASNLFLVIVKPYEQRGILLQLGSLYSLASTVIQTAANKRAAGLLKGDMH